MTQPKWPRPKYLGWRAIAPGDRIDCDIPRCEVSAVRVVLTRYRHEAEDRHTALCRGHALGTIAVLERMP